MSGLKIKRKITERVLTHPNHPDFKITVKRLKKLEQISYFGSMGKYQIITPLVDPETKQVLRDKKGNVEVHVQQDIPLSAIEEMLSGVVKSWTGLKDEDENPIAFSRTELYLLFEDELNVTLPNPKVGQEIKDTNGNVTGVEPEQLVLPCWQWVSDEVNTEEGFDPDPKESSSK